MNSITEESLLAMLKEPSPAWAINQKINTDPATPDGCNIAGKLSFTLETLHSKGYVDFTVAMGTKTWFLTDKGKQVLQD